MLYRITSDEKAQDVQGDAGRWIDRHFRVVDKSSHLFNGS